MIMRIFGRSAFALVLVLSGSALAKERTLYSFTGENGDGALPVGDLISDADGNLYGMTAFGGANQIGTIFRVNSKGKEKILYSFSGRSDGSTPQAGLVMDGAGSLYGTAGGGVDGYGVVFRLTRKGKFTVLHTFASGSDGADPFGAVALDSSGNLYGTTEHGGANCNCGTVFKLSAKGEKTTLYSFLSGNDGAFPQTGLMIGSNGDLYGTTTRGGGDCNCGTIFKLSADGTEIVLHAFTGDADGEVPIGQLIADESGNLYGATGGGGDPECSCGTVFRISTSGTKDILHTFVYGDGAGPIGRLLMDDTGTLYGATFDGGFDWGTVYKLSKSGREKVIYSFTGGEDGLNPSGGLAITGDWLAGVTREGGAYQQGNVYKLRK